MKTVMTLVALIGSVASLAAQSPDGTRGTLVVLNKSSATATFIDVASGEIRGTLPTGSSPHELAMSVDGRTAVATNYGRGANSLTVFDVAAMRVERTIPLGEYRQPHGAFFLPGDSILAVTSEADRAVVLVRVADGSIVKAIPTEAAGSHMVAVVGDGRTLYTGDMSSGSVSRLDVASGTRTRSYPVPATPEAITVSADGREVWVGSNGEGLVSVLDPETGEVDRALSGFEWPYRILLVPEHGIVVIPDNGSHVVRFVELATRTELESIVFEGEGPQGVALSGDRGTLFLSLSRAGSVAVIDLATRQVVRRIAVGSSPDGIGWSPLTPGG